MRLICKNEFPKKHLSKLLVGVIILSLLLAMKNSTNVQAASQRITLEQYHPGQLV